MICDELEYIFNRFIKTILIYNKYEFDYENKILEKDR